MGFLREAIPRNTPSASAAAHPVGWSSQWVVASVAGNLCTPRDYTNVCSRIWAGRNGTFSGPVGMLLSIDWNLRLSLVHTCAGYCPQDNDYPGHLFEELGIRNRITFQSGKSRHFEGCKVVLPTLRCDTSSSMWKDWNHILGVMMTCETPTPMAHADTCSHMAVGQNPGTPREHPPKRPI